MIDELINDKKAQVSAEFILLIAGLMMIVLIAIDIYKQYLSDFSAQIKDNELDELLDKIDSLNEYV